VAARSLFLRETGCGVEWLIKHDDDGVSAGLRSMVAIATMFRNARFEGDAQRVFHGAVVGARNERPGRRSESLSSDLAGIDVERREKHQTSYHHQAERDD
jgi:hypothetical protein